MLVRSGLKRSRARSPINPKPQSHVKKNRAEASQEQGLGNSSADRWPRPIFSPKHRGSGRSVVVKIVFLGVIIVPVAAVVVVLVAAVAAPRGREAVR